MRIVYLVESLQPAGAERVVMELARAEGREDCTAEIITLRETPASGGGHCPDIRNFPLFGQGEFHWPGSAPRAAWRLRRKLLQLRPDVLAIHTPKAAVVAALAGVRVPTLWVLHGHDVCWDGATARHRLSRALQRWTRRRLRARVAAVSASLAGHAAEGLGMARKEIAVVPNGVDTARFRFEEKTPTDDVVVCMLGRLVPWKGPWQALEAFRLLKKRFPLARLWFVGDGPMRDELAAVVEALGWEHAVTFWGTLEHPEERLRQATVLWMPSEGEGFGIACVEAMATGTPVLGFDVRGVRDLLQQGCGVLAPPQDARELAVQTARLVSDENRYRAVARAARARVEREYSVERMRAGHMELMRALCNRLAERRTGRMKRAARTKILYITYDGLMEPLGQSQVLPYVRALAGEFSFTILSFEKPQDLEDSQRRQRLREQLEAAGIRWIPLRYHKRPSVPATAFDVVHGVARSIGTAMRQSPAIVHVRGYVPGVIALGLKSVIQPRLVFDMRGFWPDEKVDGGAWRQGGAVYRAAKWFEKKLLTRADVVVSLTEAGVDAMREFAYLQAHNTRFEVIPTCTDLELFRPADGRAGSDGHARDGFVLGYAGSVGTFYLFDEVLECFKELLKLRPDARLLVLNRGGHDYVRARAETHDIPDDRLELRSVEYREVPDGIHRMDAAAFFIKPAFSKKASAPTRLGEFLGCGIPCLVNAGVGDMDRVILQENAGVVMREFSAEARRAAVLDLLALCEDEATAARCRAAAEHHFSLEGGAEAYRRIYLEMEGRRTPVETAKPNGGLQELECDRELLHR